MPSMHRPSYRYTHIIYYTYSMYGIHMCNIFIGIGTLANTIAIAHFYHGKNLHDNSGNIL